MARVKGRDVVIDLMDSVAQLQATTREHGDLLESMAARTAGIESELHELSLNFMKGMNLVRTTETQLARFARLLGGLASSNDTRFEVVEARLRRLEKKTG